MCRTFINRTFINSLLFKKGEFLYKVWTKWHTKITWHDDAFFNVDSKKAQKDEKLIFYKKP